MLGRFAANSTALSLAVSTAVLKRALSQNIDRRLIADQIITSIVYQDPESLYVTLMSQPIASKAVPEGTFGQGGVCSISQIHEMLIGSAEASEPSKSLTSLRKEYRKITDPTQERPPRSYTLEAFRSMALEYSPDTIFEGLIKAQIKEQCNAIPIITSLILSNTVDPKKIAQAQAQFASNSMYNLSNYTKIVCRIGALDKAMKELKKHDPELNLGAFYSSYDDLCDAELQFRICTKQNLDITIDSKNFSSTHPVLQFFIKNQKAISLIDKATVLINQKNYEGLEKTLGEIPDEMLNEFMDNQTQNLNGRMLVSSIIKSEQAESMQAFIRAGYDPAKWHREELICHEDHPLNQAIKLQNPEMVRILLEAGAPLAEEFYTEQGVKSPLQNALESISDDENDISQEILCMIFYKAYGQELPSTKISSTSAKAAKTADKDKPPQR